VRQANGMRRHIEVSAENLSQCRAGEHAPSEDDVRSSPRVLELAGRKQGGRPNQGRVGPIELNSPDVHSLP
jgi:hypothetical protein